MPWKLRRNPKENHWGVQRLQAQLKQSEAEMEEMGSKTARMAEELRQMRERADAQLAAAPATAPPQDVTDDDGLMQVHISMPEASSNPMDGVSVHISIDGSEALVRMK